MDLEQQAARHRLERPVVGAWRAHRIGERCERLAAVAVLIVPDGEIAGKQEDLLPMVVCERPCRECSRSKAQDPRPCARLVRLVERARQNLLGYAGRVAWKRLPTGAHVHGTELVVYLVDGHRLDPDLRSAPGGIAPSTAAAYTDGPSSAQPGPASPHSVPLSLPCQPAQQVRRGPRFRP